MNELFTIPNALVSLSAIGLILELIRSIRIRKRQQQIEALFKDAPIETFIDAAIKSGFTLHEGEPRILTKGASTITIRKSKS